MRLIKFLLIDLATCITFSESILKNLSHPKKTGLAPKYFKELIVVLDDVRDPGNLGTIIRLCDWFGVKDLVCSLETVDCFNPKVIQATMGSVSRVNVTYLDLPVFLKDTKLPIFGTFMSGTSVYAADLTDKGMLILGNEAYGISNEIEPFITNKISIPRFGALQTTESLNVATAAAIFLSEFKRR